MSSKSVGLPPKPYMRKPVHEESEAHDKSNFRESSFLKNYKKRVFELPPPHPLITKKMKK